MKEKEKEKPDAERKRLDVLNDGRVETTKRRVAHAIGLLSRERRLAASGREFDVKNCARAVSLLEAAGEEMRFACSHFGWDDGVCMSIDDATLEIGCAIARIAYGETGPELAEEAGGGLAEALVKLSKALATLLIWYDDWPVEAV